jgi:hypothetical protein
LSGSGPAICIWLQGRQAVRNHGKSFSFFDFSHKQTGYSHVWNSPLRPSFPSPAHKDQCSKAWSISTDSKLDFVWFSSFSLSAITHWSIHLLSDRKVLQRSPAKTQRVMNKRTTQFSWCPTILVVDLQGKSWITPDEAKND